MAPSADAALQKLTTVECTALGIIGGIIEVSLLQPILYLKNASQQGLPFTLDPKLLYRSALRRTPPSSGCAPAPAPMYFLLDTTFRTTTGRRLAPRSRRGATRPPPPLARRDPRRAEG